MSTPSHSARQSLLPIVFTAFIDMLGIGIILPVLAPLIIRNEYGLLADDTTESTRFIIYGLMTAIYPLSQFFGAPLLGALSDRFGRKKIMFISIMGTMFGYLLMAWGVVTGNIVLLFASRALDGFTGGNISVAFSVITDISKPETRAQNFGLIGTAFGVGFIIGPVLGGILADSTLVSWFNPATPFWAAALLSAINLLMVIFILKETLKEVRYTPITPFTGIKNVVKAFSMPDLRAIFSVTFLLTLGFTFFTQFYSVFLIGKFDFREAEIGTVFGAIGLWIAITQGILVRIAARKWGSWSVLRISMLTLAISVPLILIPSESYWQYLIIPFIALSQGFTAPNINSVIASMAPSNQQGSIMGINQSVASMGHFLPALLAGFMSKNVIYAPTIVAGVILFLAWLLLYSIKKR